MQEFNAAVRHTELKEFTDEQIVKFKNTSEVEIGIDHPEYSHTTKLSEVTRKSLSADFI